MEVLWKEGSQRTFPGYSLVLPSVSIANVGQLAIDVLIATLETQQIAVVHHPALLPMVGSNAYEAVATGLTTGADLHICQQYKLLLLQLRAPHAKGRRGEFVGALCEFADKLLAGDNKDTDSSVSILASCQAADRISCQMTGTQLRYYPSKLFRDGPMFSSLREVLDTELEEVKSEARGDTKPFLSGAGYVKQFIETCGVASVCLLKFVNEGDNTSDALQLASCYYSWLARRTKDAGSPPAWRCPPSWKNMFGAPAPRSLFL
uniref:Proteasome assembly chaperone 2 n=1 Tax=Hirondellea gigas TaxID=1518452 RepID=A0A2P2HYM0_9CRUS